tara:strand:- start:64 stop:567 length:504 start_codon:yes stop_codon:yes gene_type:complete
MAEVGCLKDGCFQNLQVEGTSTIAGNLLFKRKVRVGAFSSHAMTISSVESGSIITIPVTGANSTITLPLISSGLSGFFVTLVCATDNGAHTITLQQGEADDGSGTPAATPFFGILMDDGVNSLDPGTTSAVIGTEKFKQGDQIELTCDGTNYIIKAQTVTTAAITVS